tara:strand:- start:136 stop:330 length:195 start_codon:yes stop_codon:yes gene_type:complete
MTLLDMKLSEMQQACIDLGIDASFDGEHYQTVLEMFWDGHTPEEIKEWIEVEQDREHYAYIPEL